MRSERVLRLRGVDLPFFHEGKTFNSIIEVLCTLDAFLKGIWSHFGCR
jgi:hypothetical protein